MADKILKSWWEQALAEVKRLADASDMLDVQSLHEQAPRHLIARFRCQGLVRDHAGRIVEAEEFGVGISIPSDYLYRADTSRTVTLLYPSNVFHPNILPPFICIGRMTPGMPLVDIVYQLFEILTWQKWAPHDGLNPQACAWARSVENQRRLPVDTRPLKRRVQTAKDHDAQATASGQGEMQ